MPYWQLQVQLLIDFRDFIDQSTLLHSRHLRLIGTPVHSADLMLLIRASFLTLGICCWNGAGLTMPHKATGRVARPCQGPNIPEANRRISHITHIVILCLEPVNSSRREQWQWQSSSSRFYLSSNTTVGISTAVLRSTQPSTLRGTVKWVPAYGLSNNNNGDGGRGW